MGPIQFTPGDFVPRNPLTRSLAGPRRPTPLAWLARGARSPPPAGSCLLRSSLQDRTQLPASRGVTQLAQRLRLDLADALARDREALAHFFERVLAAVADAEPHLDDLLLARGQRLQHGLG